MESKTPVVQMRNITKAFGSVVANEGVWLDIYKGEILALLGENGSGKTTLMNMLSGIYFPDEGQIFINSEEVVIRSPKDAFDHGIGMIHQHFKLVDVLTAAENIVLGLKEPWRRYPKRSAPCATPMASTWTPIRKSMTCRYRKSRPLRSSRCFTEAPISSSWTSPPPF